MCEFHVSIVVGTAIGTSNYMCSVQPLAYFSPPNLAHTSILIAGMETC